MSASFSDSHGKPCELFLESSAALPIVSFALAFRSGSAHDPPGKEGLARITARMLRRGCARLGAEAIEDAVDALGAEFGADATISATSVHFEVIRRNLDPFVDLVAELIGTPTFDDAELARLIREAQSELVEARDNDRTLASRAFRRTLFDGHAYGRRTSGSLGSLGSITRADVAAFYARHYTRENALVAVSGDIDRATAEAVTERALAKLPRGERVADPTPEPTAPKGRHLVFVDKPDRTQTQMCIGGIGSHAHDADHYDLLLGNTVFGGTFTSRLMAEVRSKRGWSYGASSRAGFDRRREAFSMWTAPAATDAAACLALELELLHQIRTEGIREDELVFAKNYLSRSHAFEIDTARKRVHQPLDVALYELPADYYSGYLDSVARVQLDGANASLARRLPEDDLVVAVVGTHADIGEALAKAIPNLDRVTVAPFDLE